VGGPKMAQDSRKNIIITTVRIRIQTFDLKNIRKIIAL